MVRATIIIAIALVLVFEANDGAASGQDFLTSCKDAISGLEGRGTNNNDSEVGHCIGYVKGVYQVTSLWSAGTETGKPLICFPDESGVEQMIRIFAKYLDDHPEELHKHELVLILTAFKEAFPCDDAE